MKNDVIQYERTYHRLKNKIECGILPVGTRLPGRSVLCKEYNTSERTIRRALELLAQDGYLEITARKRPTVVSAFAAPQGRALLNARKADAAQVNDLIQTGRLLCYPIYLRGMRLCSGSDWETPEALFAHMDPEQPDEFWQLCNRLWRFFIARNENELLLRTVDSLGFQEKEPPQSSPEDRIRYCSYIKNLFQTVKSGGEPRGAELEQIFGPYKRAAGQGEERQFLQMVSPCPLLAKTDALERRFSLVQERYSTVCLDLLGLIAIGRHQPGDRLPTHDRLQEIYGVSRDTTVKAVRMLQDWGVVTTAPRRGICVEMDLEGLKKIRISPESIACHVRRYLDSLELLSLTVERVASHAAVQARPEEVEQLRKDINRQWEQPYEHQLIPRTLLDFIAEHAGYHALQSIYRMLAWNLSIGRSIPKLISPDKNPQNILIYRQCMNAADLLKSGDAERFAMAAVNVFEQIRRLIMEECRRLGYWDAAMLVYDGKSLWR